MNFKLSENTDPKVKDELIKQAFFIRDNYGDCPTLCADCVFVVVNGSPKDCNPTNAVSCANNFLVENLPFEEGHEEKSYTREEVIRLIQKYNSDFKVYQDNEIWIEENL